MRLLKQMQLVIHLKKHLQFQFLKLFLFLFRKYSLVSHLLCRFLATARVGGSPNTCQQIGLMITDTVTQYFLQLTQGWGVSVTVQRTLTAAHLNGECALL